MAQCSIVILLEHLGMASRRKILAFLALVVLGTVGAIALSYLVWCHESAAIDGTIKAWLKRLF